MTLAQLGDATDSKPQRWVEWKISRNETLRACKLGEIRNRAAIAQLSLMKGIRRLTLSTNNSSLAFDDIKEHIEDQEVTLDPEFNLIIDKLEYIHSVSTPVKVRGRVTVSF